MSQLDLSNLTIVIADDSRFFRVNIESSIQSLLPDASYEYFHTKWLLQNRLEDPDFKPDIVFLDLNFPDGNTLDLIASMKKKNQSLHIIVTSAQSSVRVAIQTLDQGADYYVCKDESFNADLLTAVHNIIGKIKLRNENIMLKDSIFSATLYPMVLYSFSEIGSEVIYRDFETFPEDLSESIDSFLINMGISFLMLLRGGDEYHEGCYNFPAGSSKFFNTLLFSFRIPNPYALDERLKMGFYQFCLFIPNSFSRMFPPLDELSSFIDVIKDKIEDATQLTPENLDGLKSQILQQIKEKSNFTNLL